MVYVVEEAFDVGLYDVVGTFSCDGLVDDSQGIMAAAVGAKSVGVVYEVLFVDGLQNFAQVLRPALYEPLCIDLFEVGQAQQAHDYDDGNLA